MDYIMKEVKLSRAYYERCKSISQRIGRIILEQARAQHDEVEENRAIRQLACSKWLEVAKGENEYRVIRTQACKSRLCPWCAQRRSRRAYWSHCALAKKVEEMQPGTRWLLVTVTIRSIQLHQLYASIRHISSSWAKMLRKRFLGASWPGYIRSIEVTYNQDTGLWHPHIHAMIPASPSYWGRNYISQAKLCEAWAKAAGLAYMPICDIRPIYSEGGIAEISKYATKPLVVPPELLIDVDRQLLGLRLLSYGGICREAKKALSMPDPDTAIDGTEDNNLPPIPATATEWWLWNDSVQAYLNALPQAPPPPQRPGA